MKNTKSPKTNTRYSEKRQAILATLQNTTTHPSAEWLFQSLKPTYPDLSLGTIYRNLIFFQEQGDIQSVGVVNGQERFDATTHSHPHFICQECGAVHDLHSVTPDPHTAQAVTEEYGFQILKQELTFYGICKHCQGKETSEN